MVLDDILAAKRTAVAERMKRRPLASFQATLVPSDRGFREALQA